MVRIVTRLLLGYRIALVLWMSWLTLVFLWQPYGPEGTFGGYGGFSCMRQLGHESRWAIFTGIMALIGVSGVFTSSGLLRVITAGLLCSGFWTLAFFLACGRLYGTGTGVYLSGGVIAFTLMLSEIDLVRRRLPLVP